MRRGQKAPEKEGEEEEEEEEMGDMRRKKGLPKGSWDRRGQRVS